MTAPIGPGDWVEYLGQMVPGEGLFRGQAPQLGTGAAFRVDQVIDGFRYLDGWAALTLCQVPGRYSTGQRFAYDVRCFRPIYRPNQELIEQLLQPAPAEPKQVTA